MKILRIIARLNVGGPAQHVVWLTDRMRRRGHESVLVSGIVPEGEEDMGYFAEQNGVTPVYIRELTRELSPGDAISLWKLYRIMKRQRPDIIHTHTAKAGTVGRLATLLYRWATWRVLIGQPRQVRVVHTFHGHVLHGYYGKAKSSLFKQIEKILAATATDKIIVISEQQLQELNGTYRIGRSDQFQVVRLGIDLTSYSSAGAKLRAELNISADTLLVAFVGRLTEIKDIPLLLRGIAAYRAQRDAPRMRLVVIGDGGLREELEALTRELHIDDIVVFLGNRNNIAELLGEVDIVALTSKNEGTPLSLIEAMAAGKAVLATAVGGVVDLVGPAEDLHDGYKVCERGVAVTTRRPEDLASALIYAAQNEKLRERMAESGRKFVLANYSVERLEEDITRLYEELLTEKGGSHVEAHV
jgi:glycosyltransferase involved in cell wall biosynthesis